jgi:hypothetical protein
MPKSVSEFKSVSLSKPLIKLILKFIEDHPEYRSVADFVNESARVRMQELIRLGQMSTTQGMMALPFEKNSKLQQAKNRSV